MQGLAFLSILLVLCAVCASLSGPNLFVVLYASVISILAYFMVFKMIPTFMEKLKKNGLAGKDLNKCGKEDLVPEALGIVPAFVFLISVIFCQVQFQSDPVKLGQYNAGLTSISFMVLLGFVDDVIDLPWRYKMVLPTFASLPLLLAYSGPTQILIPPWLHFAVGATLDLGIFYMVYMMMLAVFCSNCINILAGVNGLEVGQSVVIAIFVILHNLIEVNMHAEAGEGAETGHLPAYAEQHLFSLLLTLPFAAVSLALLVYNWYPSQAFVGDTFTYFAGMFFAVSGILGHFSRTLLLLFIPQILNFLISCPQLFGLVACPRHRIPKVNPKTGLLEATPNLTILNGVLKLTGPLHERTLVTVVLGLQVACCCLGLAIRYSPVFRLIFI
uniref:UDP-N-acetylglucosamine--dolichyl-phosphate N-acetylglucosaminephosphotransferase n=1 Tax=Chromera velia CCMP2878 TaxID=1169474 RepID=A0A0G4F2K3_9ALVE|eukprot:Cvel_14903.t1-p1 / transcript=Cvel_14903.t1 / gene=Cvel_14903 / organism=Chromera_velia_CCMP2878 / gene_product=UDP-N-acetylglucosamine--dolichyl-phosphate, putative / transcript_product=UDP-N-acetylglucosamine--dolichyl-phosphate, putative / location=Cvel_scaffold1080:5481-11509(+) / protein_length=385 / sequence_SO=supercontig / SO=protein_coding / is_pseudo=false